MEKPEELEVPGGATDEAGQLEVPKSHQGSTEKPEGDARVATKIKSHTEQRARGVTKEPGEKPWKKPWKEPGKEPWRKQDS